MKPPPQLKRSLSLPLITFYGIGTILGAGIYVLIGKVVGHAGAYAPFSFLLAAAIAAFTGLSYAELSSLYPKSAGEALYVEKGFSSSFLGSIIGVLVAAGGIISAGAIIDGFVGYFQTFSALDPVTIKLVLGLVLTFLAILGIMESVGAAALITLVEIAGLIFIIYVARANLYEIPTRYIELIPDLRLETWQGILTGSFLAFYAFIGFEDMVNVAEEVIEPRKNLPNSIILAITVSTTLYFLIALVSVLSADSQSFSLSAAPLADLVASHGSDSRNLISFISMLAIVNGALIQMIMASRVLYGLA